MAIISKYSWRELTGCDTLPDSVMEMLESYIQNQVVAGATDGSWYLHEDVVKTRYYVRVWRTLEDANAFIEFLKALSYPPDVTKVLDTVVLRLYWGRALTRADKLKNYDYNEVLVNEGRAAVVSPYKNEFSGLKFTIYLRLFTTVEDANSYVNWVVSAYDPPPEWTEII